MAKGFNIFGKLSEEIDDFDKGGVYIVGKPDSRYESPTKRGERGGYYHSQKDLLSAIDLASASKFKKGIWDDEGQRKTYLNIVNFYRDVMKMKIGINVSNYILKPTHRVYTWAVWAFNRVFRLWAMMDDYDDKIAEFAHDLATYGTTVAKKLHKDTERVPLRSLRNTQTAKSLYGAAANGGYVIIDDEKHYNEMKMYPDWDLSALDKAKSYPVYERYGLVPQGLIDGWMKMTDLEVAQYIIKEDEDLVLAMAIIIPEGVEVADRTGKGEALLFLEVLDEDTWPLEECHVEKVDGRWIGRGEIEKQLENQIARNLNANYRRRGILWAAKKVFQSSDENIQENLVYEVADGQVLHPKANGTITQVNTASQHVGEIQNDDNAVKENSQQNAFAFEVATGEALPSGTPFRLGVVLSQAVAQHFTRVRQTFSNFLKRCFFDQVIPLCKEEYADEHEAIVALNGPGVADFREEIIVYHTNLRVWDSIIANGRPNPDEIRAQVEQELARNEYAFIDTPAKFYENAEFYMELNITDDISADIADLTTLYQAMVAKGDPRADRVLEEIFAMRGKALPAIAGPIPKVAAPVAPPTPNGAPVAVPPANPAPVGA